jgi:hypothetical protein
MCCLQLEVKRVVADGIHRNEPPAAPAFNGKTGAIFPWDYGLGFTADFGRDGYTVGSPAKYSGDYCT